ncbi:hypothetical protein [Planococcus donghaensis]|uniref:hypothetical protein n=1 Tax=Planococcus donghaensis TaxID=414778 RepID=UPI003735A587
MKIIIQKVKDFFIIKKQQKISRTKQKAFDRMDALKTLLLKTRKGYASKIVERDATYSKALIAYNSQYKEYRAVIENIKEGTQPQANEQPAHDKLKPYEQAVNEADEALTLAKDYQRIEILDLTGQIKDLQKTYLQTQAKVIIKDAYKAEAIKQQYFKQLKTVADSYGEVTDLDYLLQESLKDIGQGHDKKLGETIASLTEKAPLSAKDITLDASAVLSKIR